MNYFKIKTVKGKILILALLCLFCVSNSSKAQNVDIGLKAGLNISNLIGFDDKSDNMLAMHIGGLAEFKLGNKFSLQPELLYSRHGAKFLDVVKFKLDYLTIPVLTKFYLGNNFSIETGPQLAFLVQNKFDYKNDLIPDVKALPLSSVDFGFNLGFSMNITNNFFTQLRYYIGITALEENPDYRNSVFQISMGYKFK